MQEKVKVLVADDNGMTREMMHQGLGRMEEVQVVGLAANGQEAVEMLRKFQPDILVLDLVMPVLDGVGVLEEIKRLPRQASGRIGAFCHGFRGCGE